MDYSEDITDPGTPLIILQKEKRAANVARSAAAVKVRPFGFASKKSSFWSPLRSAQKSIFPRKTLTSTTPWAEKAALFSFSFFFSVFLSFLFFLKNDKSLRQPSGFKIDYVKLLKYKVLCCVIKVLLRSTSSLLEVVISLTMICLLAAARRTSQRTAVYGNLPSCQGVRVVLTRLVSSLPGSIAWSAGTSPLSGRSTAGLQVL